MTDPAPALEIEDLAVTYGSRRGRDFAIEGVTLDVREGETVALVGESGSGKSTTGLAAVGLLPAARGHIRVAGAELTGTSGAELRRVRSRAHMVFQNATESLNPRRSVGWSIAEPLRARRMGGRALEQRVGELLDEVGLSARNEHRFPHELSGGQRQRVGIARALAANPRFVVCDEPTSALDVSVQAQIVNLLLALQAEHGTALLFISHDLGVVESVAHRVAVMKDGRVVEFGVAEQVLRSPSHEYTARMLAAVPTGRRVTEPGGGGHLRNDAGTDHERIH